MQVSAKIDDSRKLRLLQLTPKLEKSLREGSLTLRSNALGDKVYVCTQNSTHLVRKLKQSNSLLLSSLTTSGLKIYSGIFELLETLESEARVDWSRFPTYEGRKRFDSIRTDQKTPDITCSPSEFEAQLRHKPAVRLDSRIFLVAPHVVHDVIVDVVSAMVEKENYDLSLPLADLNLESDEKPEVIASVYNKFYEKDRIDLEALSAWIGLYVLKQSHSAMRIEELYKEWAIDLPIKMPVSIEILRASVVQPKPGLVQFIDIETLSTDPRARLEGLFSIKTEWGLAEIAPLLEMLVPSGQKLENWILKFARKRRQGEDFVVQPMRR